MFRRLAPIFGTIAVILLAFLLIGLALPGTWEADGSTTIEAPPDAVYALIVDLTEWDRWTQWSDVESVTSDPSAGVGATRSWDNTTYGEGVIEIVRADRPSLVGYRVEIEGGKSTVDGVIRLTPVEGGTRVEWSEAGDFGRNALMGYMARRMPASQSAMMTESLNRLESVVTGGGSLP